MPQPIKAYLGVTPLFTQSTTIKGFAYIEGADTGTAQQALTNEFKHWAGNLTIFGNVTSTKDFHLCEGISTAPANCTITGTLTQTNAGPQGASNSPRGFTVAQSAGNVGTLTIDGGNVTLYAGGFVGDNQSTGAVGAVILNSGTFLTNGSFWLSGPNNTLTINAGSMTTTQLYVSNSGHATLNPNPVSVVTINGGVLNINLAAAASQSNLTFGTVTSGVSSTNTLNLNGGTLKHNQVTCNTPASGRTIVTTINFNGGTLDLDKGSSRNLPNATPAGATWNFVIKNGGAILSVASATSMVLVVAFSNDGTDGGLTKIGAGTLDLGSLAHSYNGATTISAGTLTVNKTSGSTTAAATFTPTSLSVSFNIAPTAGMTFRFFPGATATTGLTISLTNASGRTGTYNYSNSTLTIA